MLNKSYKMLFILLYFLSSIIFSNSDKNNRTEYLNFAINAAEWIISTSTSNNENIWPDDLEKPTDISLSISSGVPGKILFFSQLYKSTNNSRYLNEAIKGGNYLLNKTPKTLSEVDSMRAKHTLYGGLAGMSYTLLELFDVSKDQKFYDGAFEYYNWMKQIAIEENEKVSFGIYNDVLAGNAGAGLFFIYFYEKTKDQTALEYAEKLTETFFERAIKEKTGLNWKLREDKEFLLPNFSHGAGGIGYFFAKLYEVTKNKKYLETAVSAADYIKSISKQDDNIFITPYGFPLEMWIDKYDVGWAHGPAGTARLFYKLWELTNDYEYLTILRKSAEAIKRSGLPGIPSSKEFGEKPFYIDLRFGQASVANFFMDLYYFDCDEEYLSYAKLLVDDLINKSSKSEKGIYWQLERYSFMADGGNKAQFTGYFYGAAGYGLTLLHLDNVIRGNNEFITLPDNPFKFGFKTIEFKSTDGLTITADLYDSGNKNNPMVILFHRSASSRGQYRKIAPRLQKEGFNCLAVDTRWGGPKNSLRIVDNQTGKRFNSYETILNHAEMREKVWETIFDSYKDLKASVNWVKESDYNGEIIVLGSSITSILILKLAKEMKDEVSGVASYSPGEYYPEDTTMVRNWASQLQQHVLIVSAQSEAEEQMTVPIFELIPSKDKTYFKAEIGSHGSIILLEDEKNWKPLLKFLDKFK